MVMKKYKSRAETKNIKIKKKKRENLEKHHKKPSN